jgi:hypothetical protein
MIAFPANQEFRNQRPGGRALGAQTGPHVVAKRPGAAKSISQLAWQHFDRFAIVPSACPAKTFFGEGGQGLFAMLISWIVLAIGQLSAASLPLTDVTAAASRPTATPITPGEPSTLVEAVIGIGLVAAYVLLARRVRTRRQLRPVSKPTDRGTKRKAA